MKDMIKYNYSFEWGERASLWLHDFFSWPFTQEAKFPWNNINNSFMFVINPEISGGYIKKEEYHSRGEEHGKFFLKKSNIFWLIKTYENIIEEINFFVKKIEETNFNNMNKEELLPFFKEFVTICNKTCSYYRGTRHEAEYEAIKIIKKIIKEKLPEQNVDKIFNILVRNPFSDPISIEKQDWISLLNKNSVCEKDFWNHVKKHSMFFTNIYSEEELLNTIKKNYKSDKQIIKKIKNTFEEDEKKKIQIIKKQEELLRIINSQKLNNYLIIFQRFGEYRFRLKPGYAGIEVLSLKMLSRIGNLMNKTVHEMHELLTIKETLDFLKKGLLPKQEILDERKIARIYFVKNKKPFVIQGEEAINFLNKSILKKEIDEIKLKGLPASPGLVRGKVKLVLSNNLSEIEKIYNNFQKGDILITHSTQPNMVPLMKKASAIVTAQGGITSHSAVVAREFNIPCIVNIPSVTLKLKDGDYIEVNANKGIVKKLEKKL